MLSKLLINNFIIIDRIELLFSPTLNIFIGETGAGKSIVVDALMMVFGGKASVDYVRAGTNKAIIEANFFFPSNHIIFSQLQKYNIEDEYAESISQNNNQNIGEIRSVQKEKITQRELIIRREIPIKGNSRCFINDNPITLSVLNSISHHLVDFHGQNEQQKIIDTNYQLQIIDSLVDNKSIFDEYKNSYLIFLKSIEEYKSFISKKDDVEQRKEILTKSLAEINEINPIPNEDTQINFELKVLENAEYLFSSADNFINLIDNSDLSNSIINDLLTANKLLADLSNIDNSFKPFLDEFHTSIISIQETLKYVTEYKNNIEFNNDRIEALRNRYQIVRKLVKRYGSIEATLQAKIDFQKNLELLDNFDETIANLLSNIELQRKNITSFAINISEKRKIFSKNLENDIVKNLATMGMNNARFNVDFNQTFITNNFSNEMSYIVIDNKLIKINENGFDTIEFYFTSNKGEALSSLANSASGGEISRIMLAIKSILANLDNTPLLIFDEIDSGISGRVAQMVGKNMKYLSQFHQIIAITHLPQIAAQGDNLVLIEKAENDTNTITSARQPNGDERIFEIAKLISGEIVTDAAILNAKELITFG